MSFALKMLGTLALLCGAPGVACAATIVIQSNGFDALGHRSALITYAPANFNATVQFGRNRLAGMDTVTLKPVTYLGYSLDVLSPLDDGNFTLQALSSIVDNPVKLSQIRILMSNADPLADSPNKSAAIQLAIWEIIYERGTASYNLATGDFKVRGGDGGTARMLANKYLANIQNHVWSEDVRQQFLGLTSVDNQGQLVRAPVPEPAAWTMMIGGFGLIGAALRRRRGRGFAAAGHSA